MNIKNYWHTTQLSYEQSIKLFDSQIWKNWTAEQCVKFQLFQERLCMDFGHFNKCMSEILGRSVFTHEYADHNGMVEEYLKGKTMPTFEESCSHFSKEMKIVFGINN